MKNKTIFSIYLLSSLIYFTQGIEGLPGLAFFLYLKEHLGFSAEKIMYIGSITGLAWVVKPLWGYLCDNYFTKKIWITFSLLGSITIATYFGLSSILPLLVIIGLLTLSNFNSAVRDVAADGVMCVSGKDNDNCDKIQAVQWTSITIAGILASLGGGYIAQHFSYKLAYLCLIPVYLIILFCSRLFKEEKIEDCHTCGHFYTGVAAGDPNKPYCHQNEIANLFNFTEKKFRCGYHYPKPKLTLWATIKSYKELFINKPFLFACLFLFLYKYSPGFGTPLMYIERDVFKWSAQFMGIIGAITSVFEILGAIIFFKYCKKVNIKKWLKLSVFLGAITTLAYLYFTPVTAIAYGIAFATLGMFVHLIVMAFMAQSTIEGKEATSFALLCSISNLAGNASNLSGAFLFPKIGLAPLIIVSAITSFICLPLIKKLNLK